MCVDFDPGAFGVGPAPTYQAHLGRSGREGAACDQQIYLQRGDGRFANGEPTNPVIIAPNLAPGLYGSVEEMASISRSLDRVEVANDVSNAVDMVAAISRIGDDH